ncbi:ADP-ribose pyrophosphatase YjhB (NUDIX family) [Aliiruegeria haliotis]|uniref:ADP-ribose pyrophosphatase YjhB (NUDIX family) n=1 Tax=Aliiruegeria haliotis TaxID=1280846 RepID=A0A2T0RR87_9RHOB|nr:NUDIX hydrolase [Aliiruegeria haliotis]PRY23620.1 ADP-ribose pyrophosphatase YjhB (NUDIX family) [Aliiruegeria haliotis]
MPPKAKLMPRLAVRALLLHEDKLLLVNAWPGEQSDLWCAPGGGVEPGQSLPGNLAREVMEETGLAIDVGLPCLVNEFHDPPSGFHQVEVFFRCRLAGGRLRDDWQDPERVVTRRTWVSRRDIDGYRLRPRSLPDVAWNDSFTYDPLELILR